MKCRVTKAEFRKIVAAARRAVPDEACGLLVGHRRNTEAITITAVHPSTNIAVDQHERFEVDPALHIHLQRQLRRTGEEIVGVYHSHPKGHAFPSKADIQEANYRDWVWLITAVNDDGETKTGAFLHLDNEEGGLWPPRFQEIKIELLEGGNPDEV